MGEQSKVQGREIHRGEIASVRGRGALRTHASHRCLGMPRLSTIFNGAPCLRVHLEHLALRDEPHLLSDSTRAVAHTTGHGDGHRAAERTDSRTHIALISALASFVSTPARRIYP